MSYRRTQSEFSYPFIRSVFIVLLIVFIYVLQQMSNTAPAKMTLSIAEQFVSSSDVPEGQNSQEQPEQSAEPETAMPLFVSDFLLALRR